MIRINSVSRLYYTFRDTVYALSQKYLYVLMVLIQSSIQTMVVYFYYICVHQWNKLGILILARIVLEIVLNVAVLVLFVHKLWQQIAIMILQGGNEIATRHTIRLIQVVTKYFLLSFVMITFNSSFYIVTDYVISAWYYWSDHAMDITIDIYIIYVVRAFELTLISFVLFLYFGFNKHLYRKICGKCHRGCLKLCTNVMTIRYQRRVSRSFGDMDGSGGMGAGLLLVNQNTEM